MNYIDFAVKIEEIMADAPNVGPFDKTTALGHVLEVVSGSGAESAVNQTGDDSTKLTAGLTMAAQDIRSYIDLLGGVADKLEEAAANEKRAVKSWGVKCRKCNGRIDMRVNGRDKTWYIRVNRINERAEFEGDMTTFTEANRVDDIEGSEHFVCCVCGDTLKDDAGYNLTDLQMLADSYAARERGERFFTADSY